MTTVPEDLLEQVNKSIQEAFENARKEDQETIRKLQEENKALEETLRLREEELKALKDARSNQFSPPKKGPVVQISPHSSQEVRERNSNDKKSALESIYLDPTQYSDTDEEGNAFDKTSSPIKVNFSSQKKSTNGSTIQGPVLFAPKDKEVQPRIHLSTIPHASNRPTSSTGSPPRKISRYRSIELKDEQGVDENTPPTSQEKVKQDEEEEQIADSQDEDGSIIISQAVVSPTPPVTPIEIPTNLTLLQQRNYLANYYSVMLKTGPGFRINLLQHPIKQISWDFGDFVFNEKENYKPTALVKKVTQNSIKDRIKFEQFKSFYNYDDNEVEFEDILSQIFDKFQSPPGFMDSDFPDTQELDERRRTIRERQLNRLTRRLSSCVTVEDGVQVGEFVFALDVLNQYVVRGRWFIGEH
ncbi:hypothetical protein I9W82_002520 [Candida metapsilosis]|uniref:Uncharacterized protein n=1 Tax=Candida metapsilosis TaxID=273372 RepID=A0A8H7ZHJ1_9ASCO|nr:hypothetical protein I9W82_002520 [Candida metapsilosis]